MKILTASQFLGKMAGAYEQWVCIGHDPIAIAGLFNQHSLKDATRKAGIVAKTSFGADKIYFHHDKSNNLWTVTCGSSMQFLFRCFGLSYTANPKWAVYWLKKSKIQLAETMSGLSISSRITHTPMNSNSKCGFLSENGAVVGYLYYLGA